MTLNPKASEFHPETLNPFFPISSIQEPIYLPQSQIIHSYEGSQSVFYHYNGVTVYPYNYCHQTSLYGTYSERSYEFRNAESDQTEIGNCKKGSLGFNRGKVKGFKGLVPPRFMKGNFDRKTRRQVYVLKKKNLVSVDDVDIIVPEADRFRSLVSGKTSIMIKNIPNSFGRWDLMRILDDHCRQENIKSSSSQISSYDFLYLPMDFKKHANLGYAFVNFTNSNAAVSFCRAFDNHKWNVSGNKKICEVTLAKLQGKEELINHFKNSRFVCHTIEYLPVVLTPPSDGVVRYRLTHLGLCTGPSRRVTPGSFKSHK